MFRRIGSASDAQHSFRGCWNRQAFGDRALDARAQPVLLCRGKTMSTGYRGETGLDLDALEELFQSDSPTEAPIAPPRVRHRVAEEPDDLLAEGGGRSVPDSVAFATVF